MSHLIPIINLHTEKKFFFREVGAIHELPKNLIFWHGGALPLQILNFWGLIEKRSVEAQHTVPKELKR